jgi:DNA-binding PadR family transcriptional regulator
MRSRFHEARTMMKTTKRKDPRPYLPLTPPAFHVLVALADGDKHGYAIMKEVSELTEGSVELSAGTLYGIVKRLLADGLIVPVEAGRIGGGRDDERRRYYRLTRFGREVALAEAERLNQALAFARTKHLLSTEKS